jgi:hypothetical protein
MFLERAIAGGSVFLDQRFPFFFARLAQGCDAVVFVGDVVGYFRIGHNSLSICGREPRRVSRRKIRVSRVVLLEIMQFLAFGHRRSGYVIAILVVRFSGLPKDAVAIY